MTLINQLPFPFPFPEIPGLPSGGTQTPKSGIAMLLNPLTNQIGQFYGNISDEDIRERLDGYTNQVEQITSTTFPEFQPTDMGGIGGLPFARVGLPMNEGGMPEFQPFDRNGIMKELYNPQDPQVDFGAPSYSTIDYSTKPNLPQLNLGQSISNGIGSLFGR